MIRIGLIISCLLGILKLVQGQDLDVQQTFTLDGHDTSYIKDFHEKLITKTYIVSKANNFSITDIDNQRTTEFRPNDAANLGFGVNYKAFGLAVAFIPLGNRDNQTFGRTRKLDLQGNMYTRKLGFDVRFQYYKGFFIDNPGVFNSSIDLDTLVVKRPDITTLSFGGNVFYIFNSKQFSFKNTFTHNEWQKKPAGSFFAGNSFSIFNLSGDTIIAPTTLVDTLDPKKNFQSVSILSVGGFGGYAYTFVMAHRFFITMAMAPGLATVALKATNGHGREAGNTSRLAFQFNARMGMGYNSDRFFGGISAFWDFSTFSYGQNEGSIDYTTGALRFYFGMRFF